MQPTSFTLPIERHAAILLRLREEGRVMAGDLAHAFGTSEDTIRRDLRDLAAAGLCRRVYGGALPVSPASGPLRERRENGRAAKLSLGRAAAALSGWGDVVLIDAGSTNLCIATALPDDRNLTVVTNAPDIAAVLAGRPGLELVVLGGRVDPRTGGAVGPQACEALAGLRPSLAFVGACAVSADGLAAFDSEEAAFKRLIVRNAARIAAALTNDKLGTAAPFGFAGPSDIGALVVEADAPASALAALGLPSATIHRAKDQQAE